MSDDTRDSIAQCVASMAVLAIIGITVCVIFYLRTGIVPFFGWM